MPFLYVIWDLDDDPQGNVQHIAEHGITKAEVVEVLDRPSAREVSRSSGRPVAIGTTRTGRTLLVVYDEIDEDRVYPVTAYELEN
ncbi:MAG: BrnT family toxin [Pirellulaceae bacterium]|nr:BrnT family toxin [Pirellulaceae bacterium]